MVTPQTASASVPVVARVRDVNKHGFEVLVQAEEGYAGEAVSETVGYLAVSSPTSESTVTMEGQRISYRLAQGELDHELGEILDTSLWIQEEISYDAETLHLLETVTVLELGDQIFGQDTSTNGGNTAVLRRSGVTAGGDE